MNFKAILIAVLATIIVLGLFIGGLMYAITTGSPLAIIPIVVSVVIFVYILEG